MLDIRRWKEKVCASGKGSSSCLLRQLTSQSLSILIYKEGRTRFALLNGVICKGTLETVKCCAHVSIVLGKKMGARVRGPEFWASSSTVLLCNFDQ